MTSMLPFPESLSDKYRPRRVRDFIGLRIPKAIFTTFIRNPYPSSWLFFGPSGQGKTTMGLAIAEEINAELHHIPSQRCTVDNLEEVCRLCHFVPLTKGFHLVLIDEIDSSTAAAQLQLLSKTDATAFPPNTIFIFTANNLDRLEQRFLSRCRQVKFLPTDLQKELPTYLEKVSKKERGHNGLAFARIAKEANYNVRDALMRLEVSLMAGNQVEDIPNNESSAHEHFCKKCSLRRECTVVDCKLPFNSTCKNCGGSTTIFQERARKAVATMKRNRERELQEARKGKRNARKRTGKKGRGTKDVLV